MLPAHSRLSREAFLDTFKGAKRARGVGFQLLHMPSPTFKASVVVSKKIAPLAVSRNRIRRSVYAELQRIQKIKPMTGHYIVILLPESKKLSLKEIITSLTSTLALLPSKNYSR